MQNLVLHRSHPKNQALLWRPGAHDVVCSAHFVQGKKSDDKNSPSYIPSVFPTHTTERSIPSIERNQRQQQRQQRARQLQLKAWREQEQDGRKRKLPPPLPEAVASVKQSREEERGTFAETEGSAGGGGATHSADGSGAGGRGGKAARAAVGGGGTRVEDWQEEGDFNIADEGGTATGREGGTGGGGTARVAGAASGRGGKEVRAIAKRDFSAQVDFPVNDILCYQGFCDVPSIGEKGVQACFLPSHDRKEKVVQTERKKNLQFSEMSERQIKAFTGVELGVVKFLVHKVKACLKESRVISQEDKVLLLLVRFKLAVNFSVLASYFNVCETTAKKVFREALDAVFEVAKENLFWLDKDTVKSRMPTSFRALFPNTRVIIDCSEIPCERPPKVRQRVLMYSNYKSNFTVKFLLGVAPSGEIMFVSKTYGGRVTDSEITCNSGFLELLEEGDVVLADKGFPSIEKNLQEKGGLLVMPPFKTGEKQFTNVQNQEGYNCASVRVHVERAISRLKVFEILNFVPIQMMQHIDKVLTIICFLHNLMPDLIKSE